MKLWRREHRADNEGRATLIACIALGAALVLSGCADDDDASPVEAPERNETRATEAPAGTASTDEAATPTPAPTATPAPTPTSTPVPEGARFQTLPVGADLPTEEECAASVRPAPEIRPANDEYNTTPGTKPHEEIPRVTGNFVGTTDEIIQWAACKWGVDEDLVRAQMAAESWWHQSVGGDHTTNQALCHPDVRTDSETCPESMGLSQIKFQFHGAAYEDSNVIRSTAYNVDYAYSFWRRCYDGEFGWLNDEERGREYGPGDAVGCLGVWFWGRWYTPEGIEYMNLVQGYLDERIWETQEFIDAIEPALPEQL